MSAKRKFIWAVKKCMGEKQGAFIEGAFMGSAFIRCIHGGCIHKEVHSWGVHSWGAFIGGAFTRRCIYKEGEFIERCIHGMMNL